MARPTTRSQFKDYCLRRLGYPVIDINVDDEQVEDRIDEALLYYQDYHFDGSNRILHKHQVTQADKDNGYITLPENIVGVVRILPFYDSVSSSNMFDVRYQIHLNDLFDLSQSSYTQYVLSMTHINFLEEIFVGKKPIRYNRHIDKLYIDMNWDDIQVDEYLVVDAYAYTDPDVYADVWNDRWLQRYATSLIKRQWGTNLSKFEGMQLPGGLQFNGQRIYDEATTEIDKLEEEMITSYSLPVSDMVG